MLISKIGSFKSATLYYSALISLLGLSASFADPGPLNISGVYPHLTMYNNEYECGSGAVVPWADRLWVITYAPHKPIGSSDKLYEITPDLEQIIRPESIGGTPANRMIHRESDQLLIGPYLIDQERNIRVISVDKMPGRLTGNARHLVEPTNKVYYATMEEGLYSVNVNTLEVEEHIQDGNKQPPIGNGIASQLPGYHGKGLYSGQGLLVYANNGEKSPMAKADPTTPSGALAQWTGTEDWELVRRNQFTEVSGPNGIYGGENPDTDPIWTMGWDARSLLLGLLEKGDWTFYRLPKGSHSYDGAHGWNTEWPRIRDIGEKNLLATMHGTFWQFPRTFSRNDSAGISPRSNYLKVVGDFALWNGKLVLGCDDSARGEFLNTRDFKSKEASPKQSNSNLWFIDPNQLDTFGPPIGRGSVWLNEKVESETASDPYLFSGYDYRQLSITHASPAPVTFTLEVDKKGNGQWETLRTVVVPSLGSSHQIFDTNEKGAWIRLKTDQPASGVTAHFHYRNRDERSQQNDAIFRGVAAIGSPASSQYLMRSLAFDKLGVVAAGGHSKLEGYYELNPRMELAWVSDPVEAAALTEAIAPPSKTFSTDGASIIMEEDGKRYRFPKNDLYSGPDDARVCREVATERDLLNLHGTFYELPARNAQGMAKIRPIATHNLSIQDFCSHNGLLFFTGLEEGAKSDRIFRSEDGKVALWAGVVDDLWKLGKPRGKGGPWKQSAVAAGVPSDPYLMTAFDSKTVELSSSTDSTITLEVDIDGTDLWLPYKSFNLKAGQPHSHQFPQGFSAYWVRATSDRDTTATAWFTYE